MRPTSPPIAHAAAAAPNALETLKSPISGSCTGASPARVRSVQALPVGEKRTSVRTNSESPGFTAATPTSLDKALCSGNGTTSTLVNLKPSELDGYTAVAMTGVKSTSFSAGSCLVFR